METHIGAPGTIERLYREEGRRLWWALMAFSGDPEIASDSVAEAFAQALGRGDALIDPLPWFGAPLVSWRPRLSASSDGQFGELELALSIAGEPVPRWKLPAAGLTNSGFDWRLFASFPRWAL